MPLTTRRSATSPLTVWVRIFSAALTAASAAAARTSASAWASAWAILAFPALVRRGGEFLHLGLGLSHHAFGLGIGAGDDPGGFLLGLALLALILRQQRLRLLLEPE